ncbi:MAG: ABC transporter permease [Lachnospiraceae bacterium]|nr:ABC transporter permease [Lachnospiraceae bacterium]
MIKQYKINQSPEKVLERAYSHENKNRNRILLIAVTLSIVVMFCIMSTIYGKNQADVLRYIQADGMTVSTYLENGTEDSYAQLKKMSYVKDVGLENRIGKLMNEGQNYATCVALDSKAYEKMVMPSFLEVHGKYPQEADEIMLSVKTLEYLGIDNPKIGMSVFLDFYWNNIFSENNTGNQRFILAGYYIDLRNSITQNSVAYISQRRLQENSIKQFPCRLLIDVDKNFLSGEQIESQLYKDLALSEKQRIVGNDSAAYRAMEETVGGIGIGILLSMIILLALFLFVFNVIYISLDKEIRQYGLLEILGVENRQIRKIVYFPILRLCLIGSVVGGIIACIIVGVVYPLIINRMYQDMGGVRLNVFFPAFLAIACLVTCLMVLFATSFSLHRLKKLTPIQAVKYENIDTIASGRKKSARIVTVKYDFQKKRNPIWRIAWGNVIRSKKKFIITILSLTLGCQIVLMSSVIANGTDFMNKLLENNDFEISLTQNAIRTLIETSTKTEKMVMFDNDMISQGEKEANIPKNKVERIEGFLPIVDEYGQDSIRILDSQNDPLTIIQKLDKNKLDRIEGYVKKNEPLLDIDSFMQRNGVFILHNHLLSEQGAEVAKKKIGKNIGVCDLVPVGTDMSESTSIPLVNCGYIDISKKEFPDLDLMWQGENTVYLIVSENTFSTISKILTKQTFQMHFNVPDKSENETKIELKQWIRRVNMEFQTNGYSEKLNLLSLTCNSDLIASEQKHILVTRFIMWTISTALSFIGIVNYLNTIITDIMTRKREFAIMESIGLTRKQLRWMLTLEGLFYCILIAALLGSVGSGILYVFGICMHNQMEYFTFKYPVGLYIGIIIILILFCTIIPRLIYRRFSTESAAECLRRTSE